MHKWICFFVCLSGLLISYNIFASDVELRNLRWDWEVYDEDAGHFVPYFKQPNTQTVRFDINLNKYRNSYLKLVLPEDYFIWIEGQLVFANLKHDTKYLALDSLSNIYKQNIVQFTLHSESFDDNAISSTIVNIESENNSSVEQTAFLHRESHQRLDLFIMISVATLSLIALFRAFNFRLFSEYFSLGKALRVRQNFDLITAHAPIAWPNIGFIIFYAVLVGNTAMNIGLFQPNDTSGLPLNLSSSINISFGLKISAYCFLLMLAKLLIINLGTELFKIKKVKVVHFFTYFRLSLIMSIVVFSLSVFNGIFGGSILNEHWNLIQLFALLAWFCRFILIFFVLNKIYTFRKLHLFSYLCSSELIPLLLFFKIFLK